MNRASTSHLENVEQGDDHVAMIDRFKIRAALSGKLETWELTAQEKHVWLRLFLAKISADPTESEAQEFRQLIEKNGDP